jgi:hypothetical protein
MVAAGVITTEQDLIASLLSESLAELSAALSPEKVTPYLTFATSLTSSFVRSQWNIAIRISCKAISCKNFARKGNLTPHLPHLLPHCRAIARKGKFTLALQHLWL